ncbi:MAG: DUF6125 family protein [Dehalococcoidia bacterium]
MEIEDLSREQLLALAEAYARVVMAVDGYWFMAVEEKDSHQTAYDMDCAVWEKAAPSEARKVARALGIDPGEGIAAMLEIIKFCPTWYALGTEVTLEAPNRGLLTVRDCSVQKNRANKGLEEFACKEVGQVVTRAYGKALNPQVKVTCKVCPPDPHPPDIWCQWQFEL